MRWLPYRCPSTAAAGSTSLWSHCRGYWQGGVLVRQGKQRWGAKVIERLAHDLRQAFPQMSGPSPSNLIAMRAFARRGPLVGRATSAEK
ncbi:DUF1016 N-terminal domain-containing protein [Cupriavidus necator]|uniref:DUF1016 N-terminal domain-containing protein n=1 Tax=Cupriavidus necator TaxID=106590 RepID=UPI0039C34DCA